jgi:polysaccharide deacetylase family protein (PEP-CTERM system associated)
VRQSRDVLTDIIGEDVVAYRAPSFSITRESLWALDILAEEGFKIDSSVVPVHHDRYGIPDAKACVHTIETSAGPLVECPPAVVQCGPWNLPVGGGGYFRLYPLCWTLRCLKGINRRRQPFMFYVHPWEVDPDQPALAAGSRTSRFRHRVNLATTERKLDQLLQEIPFGRVCDLVQQAGLQADPMERDQAPVELAVGV